MAATPEGRVKAGIAKLLKAKGIWYFLPVSNGMGRHGIPDFICCHGGKFLAIEAKAPGKLANVSAQQEREINAIRVARGIALVIDDPAKLDEYFKEIDHVGDSTDSAG